uniref:Uncharacterized protein n=1 Tax=Oryza brachyantha TaxID=4533 RepID=J3L528_ORYBR
LLPHFTVSSCVVSASLSPFAIGVLLNPPPLTASSYYGRTVQRSYLFLFSAAYYPFAFLVCYCCCRRRRLG